MQLSFFLLWYKEGKEVKEFKVDNENSAYGNFTMNPKRVVDYKCRLELLKVFNNECQGLKSNNIQAGKVLKINVMAPMRIVYESDCKSLYLARNFTNYTSSLCKVAF